MARIMYTSSLTVTQSETGRHDAVTPILSVKGKMAEIVFFAITFVVVLALYIHWNS